MMDIYQQLYLKTDRGDMMYKFKVSIGDIASVDIYTDIEKIKNKLLEGRSLKKTIPAETKYYGKVENIENNDNLIIISKSKIQNYLLDRENNTASILTPEDSFFFPDLVYLTIGMLSNILQKKSMYFMQCSVVKYDNENSIMLIGDPNAGKTSLAYSLISKYGYSLVANDNALVKIDDRKFKTITGSKFMQMRYGAMKAYFPEIVPYINIDEKDLGRDDWDIKVYINKYFENLGYKYDNESTVTDIYNISTYIDGNTYVREREYIDKVLYIYEHLTKQIRSSRYAITSFDHPLESFENEQYMDYRYQMAKTIVDSTTIFDAKGTIKDLTEFIRRRHE